jgi:hypothetical protein
MRTTSSNRPHVPNSRRAKFRVTASTRGFNLSRTLHGWRKPITSSLVRPLMFISRPKPMARGVSSFPWEKVRVFLAGAFGEAQTLEMSHSGRVWRDTSKTWCGPSRLRKLKSSRIRVSVHCMTRALYSTFSQHAVSDSYCFFATTVCWFSRLVCRVLKLAINSSFINEVCCKR